ncbi:MAG: amidohydrolase family protein [Deltaproteobacteria bacterium]|nr:amidohydrolase family protein [Deltaproteobacteria bacterium]
MDILVRGKYVITDAGAGEKGILTDGAVYVSGGRVVEVGDYASLKERHPQAAVKGNGKQLLMPGLIDGHSHGWGLTLTQMGFDLDFLENGLIDWAFMVPLDPEVSAMMSAVRHLQGGCTTMHHNNWGEEPNLMENAEKAISGYQKVGIRLAYSPGGRNVNRLALDDTDFFATLPPDLQEFARPMVYYDKKAFVEAYMDLFEGLHGRYNDEETRILFGPSWTQGCTDEFLQQVKERADQLGKIQIHLHTLQTPIQKAFGIRKYGKSLVGHLDDLGLVDENLTLGHAVFVTESDIELLASRGASTTHHPSCNLAVRNGISPVYHLYKAGVNVALGIDDKAINDDGDGIMELRMIHRLHRVSGFDLARTPALNAFDVLKMGTTNAARVCGFGGELGALKEGMKGDMILVDLQQIMEDPWVSPELNIAEIFINRAKGVHVNTAIVGGKVIMEDRRLLTVDVDGLYEEVRKQASRGIGPDQRSFAETLQRIKPYYHKWYEGWEKLDFDPFYVMNSRK